MLRLNKSFVKMNFGDLSDSTRLRKTRPNTSHDTGNLATTNINEGRQSTVSDIFDCRVSE